MNSDKFNRYLAQLRTSEAAFKKIYEYYLPKLKVHVKAKFGNRVDFEDVAHDVFTRLIRADNLPEVESPTAWMYKICDNIALDHLRKNRYSMPFDEGIASCSIEEEKYSAEGDGGYFSVLDHLQGEEREIVKLVTWDGYNLKEVSKILNVSHGSARQKYSRALKKLKSFL